MRLDVHQAKLTPLFLRHPARDGTSTKTIVFGSEKLRSIAPSARIQLAKVWLTFPDPGTV